MKKKKDCRIEQLERSLEDWRDFDYSYFHRSDIRYGVREENTYDV